jgi:hypothetical protein
MSWPGHHTVARRSGWPGHPVSFASCFDKLGTTSCSRLPGKQKRVRNEEKAPAISLLVFARTIAIYFLAHPRPQALVREKEVETSKNIFIGEHRYQRNPIVPIRYQAITIIYGMNDYKSLGLNAINLIPLINSGNVSRFFDFGTRLKAWQSISANCHRTAPGRCKN